MVSLDPIDFPWTFFSLVPFLVASSPSQGGFLIMWSWDTLLYVLWWTEMLLVSLTLASEKWLEPPGIKNYTRLDWSNYIYLVFLKLDENVSSIVEYILYLVGRYSIFFCHFMHLSRNKTNRAHSMDSFIVQVKQLLKFDPNVEQIIVIVKLVLQIVI